MVGGDRLSLLSLSVKKFVKN